MRRFFLRIFCLSLVAFVGLSVIGSYVEGDDEESIVNEQPKKVIIIGASSGMGRQVAKLIGNNENCTIGLVGRRVHLLKSLQDEI